ncbi:unnamed protein product [Natator depressus]
MGQCRPAADQRDTPVPWAHQPHTPQSTVPQPGAEPGVSGKEIRASRGPEPAGQGSGGGQLWHNCLWDSPSSSPALTLFAALLPDVLEPPVRGQPRSLLPADVCHGGMGLHPVRRLHSEPAPVPAGAAERDRPPARILRVHQELSPQLLSACPALPLVLSAGTYSCLLCNIISLFWNGSPPISPCRRQVSGGSCSQGVASRMSDS